MKTCVLVLSLLVLVTGSQDKYLKLSFVDPEGNPIQVTIDEQYSEPTAAYPSPVKWRESSVDGKIDIAMSDQATEQCCYVFAKGFAIDLLSTWHANSRAIRVRMRPESEIAVLIVDRNGIPIENAKVSPASVYFRQSYWIANVPHQLPDDFESRTDAEGKALIHGAVADDLQAVRVSLDGQSSFTFHVPNRWDQTSVLRFVLDVSFGGLVCRVIDSSGSPVVGATLFANTNEEFLNPLVTRETTVNFVEFLGKTGEDGCITVAHVPAIPIDVRVFCPEKAVGWGEYRKDFKIEAAKTNVMEFRQKPVSNCLVSVVDLTDSKAHEGISVSYQLRDQIDNITGVAKTNEDGICEFEAQAGEWSFYVDESTLPNGYCVYHLEKQTSFKVVQSHEQQTARPLYIGKGQLVTGKIVGFDLLESRFDWISAASKDGDEQWMGCVNENGEFRILVPNYLELDSLTDFSITGGSKGTLTAEAKSPWVLRWKAKEKLQYNE